MGSRIWRALQRDTVLRQIAKTDASHRRPRSQREATETSERWDAYQALAPGSFLNELARHLGTRPRDLLAVRPGALPSSGQRTPVPRNQDQNVFHTRLMPAGWSDHPSDFAPGSLFTLAG